MATTLASLSLASLKHSTAQLRASVKHPYLSTLNLVLAEGVTGTAAELLTLLEQEQDRRAAVSG